MCIIHIYTHTIIYKQFAKLLIESPFKILHSSFISHIILYYSLVLLYVYGRIAAGKRIYVNVF